MVSKFENLINSQRANIYTQEDGKATLIITDGDELVLCKEYASKSTAMGVMNTRSKGWAKHRIDGEELITLINKLAWAEVRCYSAHTYTLKSVFEKMIIALRKMGYEVEVDDDSHRDHKTLRADGGRITLYRRKGWDIYQLRMGD